MYGDMLTRPTMCSDHFRAYTNIESLCYLPETNIIFCVNYTSILLITNTFSYIFFSKKILQPQNIFLKRR